MLSERLAVATVGVVSFPNPFPPLLPSEPPECSVSHPPHRRKLIGSQLRLKKLGQVLDIIHADADHFFLPSVSLTQSKPHRLYT